MAVDLAPCVSHPRRSVSQRRQSGQSLRDSPASVDTLVDLGADSTGKDHRPEVQLAALALNHPETDGVHDSSRRHGQLDRVPYSGLATGPKGHILNRCLSSA